MCFIQGLRMNSEMVIHHAYTEATHIHGSHSIHCTSGDSDIPTSAIAPSNSNGVVDHTLWWDGWSNGEVK